MRIIKKNNRKMPLFPKNVVHFGFFTNEMKCERGKQVLVIKWSFLIQHVFKFSIQNRQENEFQKILYNWSISITTKANLRRKSLICSPWKSELPKNVTQRVEWKILKSVYDKYPPRLARKNFLLSAQNVEKR